MNHLFDPDFRDVLDVQLKERFRRALIDYSTTGQSHELEPSAIVRMTVTLMGKSALYGASQDDWLQQLPDALIHSKYADNTRLTAEFEHREPHLSIRAYAYLGSQPIYRSVVTPLELVPAILLDPKIPSA